METHGLKWDLITIKVKHRTSLSSAENFNVISSIFFGGSWRIGLPSYVHHITTGEHAM
jgi:hypothetical protein